MVTARTTRPIRPSIISLEADSDEHQDVTFWLHIHERRVELSKNELRDLAYHAMCLCNENAIHTWKPVANGSA